MTLALSPSILTLMAETAIRTTFIVDMATPTPRRWTNYPGGITVGSILGTLAITNGGSAYATAPIVTLSGGGGQGAEVLAIITGGVVTSLVILSRGWGYTSAPTVAFTGGGGSGAAATATIGVTFDYVSSAFSPVTESVDGSSVLSGSLSIANADNLSTSLVTDAANAGVAISVQKVWRDSANAPAGTQIWIEGYAGRPSFAGEFVSIDCYADTGRTGETPITEWSEVLLSHDLPDESSGVIA